jgi:hypothetical protein
LWTAIFVAQEVGAGLGVGEILQRSVQEVGVMLGIMVGFHSFVENEKK